MLRAIKKKRIEILAAAYRSQPIQERKILFWSDIGRRYSCNPRYLSEYISRTHPGVFDIVWMLEREVDPPKDLPEDVRIVRFFSKQWLHEIATAKYVICNQRIPDYFYFKKRHGQVYIQTWHSSLRLKMIEGDAADTLPDDYIQLAKEDSKKIDCILSGCQMSSEIIRRAFWYDGPILECGTPRIDYLLHHTDDREQFCRRAGLDPALRYALYAPTFRSGDNMDAYDVDMERLAAALEGRFGGNWNILCRLHPNVADRLELSELPACCIDMTRYHDMQELLLLSDVLITDYSSSMFDVAYLKKPCILYVSDLENYVTHERGLYFDIERLPFLLAKNNDELEACIRTFDEGQYRRALDGFMGQIGSFETGEASRRIVETVMMNK